MAWIRLDDTIWDHPKTLRLASILGISPDEAATHMIRLWTWTIRYRPGGAFDSKCNTSAKSRISDRQAIETCDASAIIGQAAQWKGDPRAFVVALVNSGYLDKRGGRTGRLTLHNWDTYTANYRRAKEDRHRKDTSGGGGDTGGEATSKSGGKHGGARRRPTLDRPTLDRPTKKKTDRPTEPKPPPGEVLLGNGNPDPEKPTPIPGVPPPSLGSDGTSMQALRAAARAALIPNNPETLDRYLKAWKCRKGAAEVQRILMMPEVRGHNVNQIDYGFMGGDDKSVKPPCSIDEWVPPERRAEEAQT